jgi:hypothetical protein
MPRRKDDGAGTQFHIGSQQGVITNVGGDQTIIGGQHIEMTLPADDIAQHIESIRAALGAVSLPGAVHSQATEALGQAEAELRTPAPDGERVAGSLERFTQIVKAAGGLAAAGLALVNPLQGIAVLLGPVGARILQALRD